MTAQAAPVPVIPFTQAAHEHVEPFPVTVNAILTANAQIQEMVVPSYGYVRHLFLQVTAAGGVGAFTGAEGYPFNILGGITLLDTNGAPLYGPLDGYQAFFTNLIGGYAFQNDLRNAPGFLSTVNPAFGLRVPVEITHDTGLGSLANQNAAAAYKLRFTLNPTSVVYTSNPVTTNPTITVRPQLEAWSLPNEVDGFGRPQAQTPPNHGTLQYWSATKPQVVAGNNYTQITRVGNLIRNLVFLARTAAPALSDTVFPDPAILSWDARQLINETQFYRNQVMWERLQGYTRQVGAFAYSFDHFPDNHCGDDDPTGWIPTVQATRLELDGNSAATGTVEIVTNDIAPIALDQANRYVETSGSGFHPNPDTAQR